MNKLSVFKIPLAPFYKGSMKISFVCHSPDASGSGIFLQKDCGQAAMTAFNAYFRVNDIREKEGQNG